MITRFLRALAAFVSAAALAQAADTVELLPGKITGSIALSSETVNSGSVYASATDGSGSASSSFNGSSFSIVVPAGKTWRLNFNFNIGNNSQISINTPESVAVGPNETVTQNYSIATARVTADVQVANGSLSSFGYLQAYGNNGTVNFSSYAYGQGFVTVLPMNGVSVYGTASLQSSAGQSSTVALASQQINVPTAGATATWNVDAAFVSSTIQGALQFNNGPTLSSAQIYAYGPNGSYRYATLSSNGSTYLFDNLQAGNYTVYSYANFPGSSLYLYRSLDLAAGSVATVNFSSDLATAIVPLNLTGFVTAAPNVYASLYAVGPDNASGNAALDSGSFKQAVTTGAWSFSQINLYSYDSTGYFQVYKYDSNSPSTTFAAGDSRTVAPVGFNTTQTEFTFDVVEAPGATSETLISYPRISGYVYRYSSTGQYIGYNSIYAQSYSWGVAKPRVRVVGEPGTYYVQAYANVDGSDVSFGNFTLELKAPLPTPVGTNVTVDAGAGVTLQFDNVTTQGVTTVSQLPVGPALPGGYSNLTSNGAKIYYSASTTAAFTGYIDVSVSFDSATVPAALEADLHLFYYDKASETWIDTTTSVDEVNNLVTGTAPGLSTFALGLPHAPTIGVVTAPVGGSAGTELSFSATFTDVDPGERHTAEWSWGSGAGNTVGVVNQATGTITGSHNFTTGGTFTGTLTLTDITGNVVTKTFTYTVAGGEQPDTTAPVITVGGNITLEATSAAGAVGTFAVSASDNKDGTVSVSTSVASGSTFPLGTTTVTATARDAAGNVATATFTVTVVDTVAPTFTSVPADQVLEATSAAGATASFAATATDATGVTLSYSQASGSTFALGTTTVTATATDAAGNQKTATFAVTVRDTIAPVLTVPGNLVLEATSAAGAVASFSASATDATGATVTYSADSGSTFALGATTVNVTAKDAVGNTTRGSFTVTVRDTTAPAFSSLSTNAPSLWPPNHKMVSITVSAAATDAVGPVSYRILNVTSNEPDNGLGDGDTPNDIKITGAMTVDLRAERSGKGSGRTYTITVEAKDANGNASRKTVNVVVPLNQGK